MPSILQVPRWSCLVVVLAALAACGPASPSPTAAPAKPAATAAPAKPAATSGPAKPAGAEAQPAASPVAKAEAKPATSAVARTEVKPAASPAAKSAAKAGFDEKAVAEFYSGKTVRFVVGFAPGGGYDAYTRTIARHIGQHIPGNPTVIVENMPGAGSMKAMNQVYKTLPRDGTAIGVVAGGLVLQQLSKGEGVEFDATKMEYLGAPSYFEYLLIVTKRSGFTSLDQMIGPNARQIVIGATGVGSGSNNTTLIAREALGINMRLVAGYGGSSDVRLALERGEVEGYFNSCDSVKSTFGEQFGSGEFLALTQLVDKPVAELPNVPLVLNFAKSEDARQLLTYGIMVPNKFARPYAIGPSVPADRVAALQSAFDQTMVDKELVADAQKAKQDILPISGADLKKLIVDFLSISPEVAAKIQKALQTTS